MLDRTLRGEACVWRSLGVESVGECLIHVSDVTDVACLVTQWRSSTSRCGALAVPICVVVRLCVGSWDVQTQARCV